MSKSTLLTTKLNIKVNKLFLIHIATFFLISSTAIVAQKKDKGKMSKKEEQHEIGLADTYFHNYEYFLAAQEYEKVVSADPANKYALNRLAESYRNFFNYDKAEMYYKRVSEQAAAEYPDAKFWYALMLKTNGKYEEAKEQFKAFIDANSHKTKAEEKELVTKARLEYDGCELALVELKKPLRDYNFENLPGPVNTADSEYSPTIFGNDSSIVFTSAREESKGDKEFGGLGGKFSDNYRFKGNKRNWITADTNDNFEVVNTKYNESAGSFNKDNTKFYFTRCDEPVKSSGGTEFQCAIYVTTKKSDKWESAVKLNENINAKGQWNAQPSISPNADTLYFVSKRPGGKGMHDLWFSICKGDDNWGAPQNLGDSINTPYIEMSPNYYSKEKMLFFASNGHKGFGGLDIFKTQGPAFTVIKNTGLPFNSNRDDFYFVVGKEKGFLSSNREGGIGNDDIYRFNLHGKDAVIAMISKDSLEKFQSVAIEGRLLEEDSKKPVEDVEVLLKDKDDKTLKKTVTDEGGNFRYDNLPTDKDYKITLKDSDKSLTTEVKYVTKDIHVKGSDQAATKTLFESLFFDFNKYDIRPEAKKILDELVAYYKKYPQIQIEMDGYTDAIGTDAYNKKLSESRGNAALQYLIQKGVKKSALVVNAQGAGKPLATNANEMGRQLNRRVEFSILGGPGYQAKAMVYVVEPKMNLFQVAKKFHMSIDELKELNALEGENVTAYKPLRVRRTGDEDIIAPITISHVNDVPSDTHVQGHSPQSNSSETVAHVNTNQHLGDDQDFYIVEPLNTLYSISKQFGMTPEELKSMNAIKSNSIHIGQRLKVKKGADGATATTTSKYIVKEGDTMFSIAKKFGLTLEELKTLNGLDNFTIYQNMVLKVKN
ncbi:MAG TPA: LysM peptidoglycan-binding domain-containing protein [Cytophagaceae bacterium]|jgi:outer membrane protein OmpA-like peptidoglycan-associated protein/tetratricopeptide (TPR) repeat protein